MTTTRGVLGSSSTGGDLPTGLIEELSQHPNIAGIKDSRGKLVGELVEHSADDFQVLVGSGALLYGALETGAVGGIVAGR